jgi:hypothetical protein
VLSSRKPYRQHLKKLLSKCCQTDQLLSRTLQHQKTRNIMSKSREVTGNTPQSSSGESTEVLERPSLQSAKRDNTQNSTPTTSPLLPPMLSNDQSAFTTPPTTEKTRQHALVFKVALSYLLKVGLVKRYKVLSPDGATVQRLRFEIDMTAWTQDLELK